MMKRAAVFFFFLSSILPAHAEEAKHQDAVEYIYYIVTAGSEQALAQLKTSIKSSRGIITYYDSDMIKFRVPVQAAAPVLDEIKKIGFIDDEKIERSQTQEALVTLRAKLKVKEEFVQKLYGVTDDAGLSSTIDLEKEIETTVDELEKIKSEIKTLQRKELFSDFVVFLRATASPVKKQQKMSRWSWINRLGVEDLVQ